MQFAIIDIFDNQVSNHKNEKLVRSWANFNKREFQEELEKINWNALMPSNKNVNTCTNIFYEKITKLLDEMAPLKKPTKKKLDLDKAPGLLMDY